MSSKHIYEQSAQWLALPLNIVLFPILYQCWKYHTQKGSHPLPFLHPWLSLADRDTWKLGKTGGWGWRQGNRVIRGRTNTCDCVWTGLAAENNISPFVTYSTYIISSDSHKNTVRIYLLFCQTQSPHTLCFDNILSTLLWHHWLHCTLLLYLPIFSTWDYELPRPLIPQWLTQSLAQRSYLPNVCRNSCFQVKKLGVHRILNSTKGRNQNWTLGSDL